MFVFYSWGVSMIFLKCLRNIKNKKEAPAIKTSASKI